MSKIKFINNISASTRQLIARSILVIVYILIIFLMFFTGRTHTLLIDNKNAQDNSYKAVKGMSVKVDNQESIEFMKGDRDKFTVKGQKHTIFIEFFDNQEPISFSFNIPVTTDAVLLSIPAYLAGRSDYLSEFNMYATTKVTAEDRGGNNTEITQIKETDLP